MQLRAVLSFSIQNLITGLSLELLMVVMDTLSSIFYGIPFCLFSILIQILHQCFIPTSENVQKPLFITFSGVVEIERYRQIGQLCI